MLTPRSITIQPLSLCRPATTREMQRAESVGRQQVSTRIATGQRTVYRMIVDALGTRETVSLSVGAPSRLVSASRSLGLTPHGSEVNPAKPNEWY